MLNSERLIDALRIRMRLMLVGATRQGAMRDPVNFVFTAGHRGVRGCKRRRDVQAERSDDRGSGRRRGAVGRPGRTPPKHTGDTKGHIVQSTGARWTPGSPSAATGAEPSIIRAGLALPRQQRRAVPLRCAQRVPV